MVHAGIVERRSNHIKDLSPEWQALWASLLASKDKTLQPALCRFVLFLNNQAIRPEQVSLEHGLAYRDALAHNETSKAPDAAYRAAVNGWNLAGRRLSDWPKTPLPLESRQKIIKLPEAAFPAEFLRDLEQLISRLTNPDPLAEDVLRILHAAAPDHDWNMQERLHGGLKRAAGRGDWARKTGRILSSAVLLKAGLSLANTDAEAVPNHLKPMLCQRDGIMIALLAILQMRCRAFCELRLGQSIHVSATEISISLSEDMTKTGVPWEAVVPPQVETVLRRYIEDVRPVLLARGSQNHDILWLGKKGEIMEQNYIGSRIGEVTLRLTGKRVPPHFFRDAAATTLARLSPESARLIPAVLAHSGFQTAERHYIHAQTIEAGRDYGALLKRLKGARP